MHTCTPDFLFMHTQDLIEKGQTLQSDLKVALSFKKVSDPFPKVYDEKCQKSLALQCFTL